MNIHQKLRSNRGETLVETLAAILVIGLVSGAFAAGISAAAKMNRRAMEKDDALYAAVTAAEQQLPESATPGVIQVTVGGTSAEIPVSFYGKEHLYTYRIPSQEAPE